MGSTLQKRHIQASSAVSQISTFITACNKLQNIAKVHCQGLLLRAILWMTPHASEVCRRTVHLLMSCLTESS